METLNFEGLTLLVCRKESVKLEGVESMVAIECQNGSLSGVGIASIELWGSIGMICLAWPSILCLFSSSSIGEFVAGNVCTKTCGERRRERSS